MAERLNAVAYAHYMSGAANPESVNYDANFNPRSVSFDVHTPQELAALNEFLITLGRDIQGGNPRRSHHSIPQHGRTDEFPPHPYFDVTNLHQLGLAGMPGVPGSGASYSDTGLPSGSSGSHHYPQPYHSSQSAGRSNHPSIQPSQFASLYPSVSDSLGYSPPNDYHSCSRPRHNEFEYSSPIGTTSSMSAYHSPQSHFHSTPPYDSHSQSSVSTPSNATPPHMPTSMPDLSSFGYLAEPRGAPPVANLAPVNFSSSSMRDIIPLKTVPGSQSPSKDIPGPPEPVEPKLTKSVHRGPPAKLTPSHVQSMASPSTKAGSLYPLLTSGDTRYKLAPLNRAYRSPSPISSRSTIDGDSRESSPISSPVPRNTVLPSLKSIAPASGIRAPESDDLARGLESIELDRRRRDISAEERRKHTKLIWNLLVSINNDYKQRFGTPKVKGSINISYESSRDIEMTA